MDGLNTRHKRTHTNQVALDQLAAGKVVAGQVQSVQVLAEQARGKLWTKDVGVRTQLLVHSLETQHANLPAQDAQLERGEGLGEVSAVGIRETGQV